MVTQPEIYPCNVIWKTSTNTRLLHHHCLLSPISIMAVYASLNGNTNHSCYTELYTGRYFTKVTNDCFTISQCPLIYISMCQYLYVSLYIYQVYLTVQWYIHVLYMYVYMQIWLSKLSNTVLNIPVDTPIWYCIFTRSKSVMHTIAILCTIIAPCYNILFLIRTQGL